MPDQQNEQLQEMHQRGETGAPDRRSPGGGSARWADVIDGAPVHTLDGEKIGTVKEIQGGYFKVNAPLQPDYWLQREFVESNADGTVTMQFKKDDLGDYKIKELPESAVLQGQDAEFRAKDDGSAIGFETEYRGGPVSNPESEATNPASETIQAAERQYDRDRP